MSFTFTVHCHIRPGMDTTADEEIRAVRSLLDAISNTAEQGSIAVHISVQHTDCVDWAPQQSGPVVSHAVESRGHKEA